MGAEFIEKAAPSFKKCWDREKVALGTADLFTRMPEIATRTAAAEVIGNIKLNVGDMLTIEVLDDGLVARQGNCKVARIANPPPEILKAVIDSYGIAKGTVEQVYSIAGVVEISLC